MTHDPPEPLPPAYCEDMCGHPPESLFRDHEGEWHCGVCEPDEVDSTIEREVITRFLVEHRNWADEPGRFPEDTRFAVVSAMNAAIQFCEQRRRAAGVRAYPCTRCGRSDCQYTFADECPGRDIREMLRVQDETRTGRTSSKEKPTIESLEMARRWADTPIDGYTTRVRHSVHDTVWIVSLALLLDEARDQATPHKGAAK